MSVGTQAAAASLARMARADASLAEVLRLVRRGDPESRPVLDAIGEEPEGFDVDEFSEDDPP